VLSCMFTYAVIMVPLFVLRVKQRVGVVLNATEPARVAVQRVIHAIARTRELPALCPNGNKSSSSNSSKFKQLFRTVVKVDCLEAASNTDLYST
jgi:hypothetical protein